jgi:Glycosyl hydrolase family 26/Bacterial Ig domain
MARTRFSVRRPTIAILALAALASSALAAPASGARARWELMAVGPGRPAAAGGQARATASRAQLVVKTVSPGGGQTVSGKVVWEATVSGATPTRVEFAVDGVAGWSQTSSPYVYGGAGGALDTTALSNGSHTLTATAYGSRGVKRGSSTVTVTVANVSSASEPTAEPASAPEPVSEPAPAPEPSPPSPLPVYWGATIGSQLTGTQAPWDMTAVTKFEELTRKPLSLIQFYQPFANCSSNPCSFYGFPRSPLESVRQHGAIPVLSWSSQSIPSSLSEPSFQLSDVIGGAYDSYIRSFAEAAKKWGHPFFLRFDWEMNGNWFPWSEGVNGNRAGEFVTAWRHVHDIFAAVGATNATWVWCPNIDPSNSMKPLGSVYPGEAYVDWTCLDGYNWGTNPASPQGWLSFNQLYRSTYRQIVETIAPTRPMLIGEVASSEYGGSKAEWIKDMLSRVPAEYPKIRGLLWFDKYDSSMDWPIETSSSATSAFAEGIQSPAYVGNSYGGLSVSPIPPPS